MHHCIIYSYDIAMKVYFRSALAIASYIHTHVHSPMNACKDILAQTGLAYLKIDKIIDTSLSIDTILKLCL